MSWLSQFWGWLTEPAGSRQGRPDRGVGEEAGRGLSQAQAVLAAEQRQLADELERLFQAYDRRVQDLALRIRDLPPAAADAEIDRLQAVQHELQSAVRRLEAGAKDQQELEGELAYWRQRLEGRSRDKDKARRQAEIIRSELALRASSDICEDGEPVRIAPQRSEAWAPVAVAVERVPEAPREPPGSLQELESELPDYAHWPEAENLVAAIREATREAERWHAIPVECHDEEALIQVKHVRDLNAWLKKVDRRNGVRRDRLELAICPRELKY